MKSLFDLVFRLATATLLLFLVNSILELNIPLTIINISIVALFESKGILLILALYYIM